MLIRQFPDIQWLKKKIKENFSDRKAIDDIPLKQSGWPNVVLNSQARFVERNDIKGPFSLFINLNGSSQVTVDGKSLKVNEQCYALSNAGQHYDLFIDNPGVTETFNIHFGEQFFQKSIYALSRGHEQLLDSPFLPTNEEHKLAFHSRPLAKGSGQALSKLVEAYRQPIDENEEEEHLYEVLAAILAECSSEVKRIGAMPLKNRAVKEEIASRLYRARDFIHAHYHQGLSLDLLAETSHLSKFHFLRMFKSLFRQTPYQYQKGLRFDRALQLYKKGHTLEQIAPLIGMDNASSVSRLFHKQVGLYPSQMVHE